MVLRVARNQLRVSTPIGGFAADAFEHRLAAPCRGSGVRSASPCDITSRSAGEDSMGKHARQKSEIIRGDNQHGHTLEFECVPSAKKLREMYVIFDGGRIAYRGQPGTQGRGCRSSPATPCSTRRMARASKATPTARSCSERLAVPFPPCWRQCAGLCDGPRTSSADQACVGGNLKRRDGCG